MIVLMFLTFKLVACQIADPIEAIDVNLHQSRDYADAFLTVEELVNSRGYKFESHQTTTADDYYLTLHRVINPLRVVRGRPVLLVHGTLDSSVEWLSE